MAVVLVTDLLVEPIESVEKWPKQQTRVFYHALFYCLVGQLRSWTNTGIRTKVLTKVNFEVCAYCLERVGS